MRKFFVPVLLVLVAVGVAGAGEKGEKGDYAKCEMPTQECLNMMTKYWKEHGWVGVELDKTDAGAGMVVTRVVDASPAAAVGLQVGDVLFAMNGLELNEANSEKLEAQRKEWTVGANVTWTMVRDGKKMDFDITLESMPADILAAWIGHHMMEHAELEVAAAP
jgi:C-terminal processing protease CtpA/Prc